ncbi:2-desacetyl-2-hydroxyethyl bacteriochlorophyllide A dehydrogenase BchC [Caenispirillum salinarum AK4]|uniref:2-desacetyl-2-hydroxyethyl bacteriochlorophyllide A dehydrogenase BchC n=1 Tax=Caenispirillum salinarum AK4 TaxID=1238182 RepID=K9H5J0_9PROT|nr:chlorophyll synthesis pathway protein BchC [Caenispirillum salinarum]EKV32842.1 2-desacetyl-2-hydroxyethyl bacteriochlorophyllide A dehydrogenase BchC [Caenispirillum salinarum AK4]
MHPDLDTLAAVLEEPERLTLRRLPLAAPGPEDVVVDIAFSGISTGTERLLWSGRMPPFPGMGYPLVPGYESVGRIAAAGEAVRDRLGETVFVPGARCFGDVRGLFGGAARRVVVPAARAHAVDPDLGERAVLLALAATAHHAITGGDRAPDLIIGHGVLGRLLARLTIALGHPPPTVWEHDPGRRAGATGYTVTAPGDDTRADYGCIVDVSGDADLLDTLIGRLAPRGEVVLAGFYAGRVGFAFPPAFMREARLRIAAEWAPDDLTAVRALVAEGRLSLEALITHRRPAEDAEEAYRTAFQDPACLKMILDWSACS